MSRGRRRPAPADALVRRRRLVGAVVAAVVLALAVGAGVHGWRQATRTTFTRPAPPTVTAAGVPFAPVSPAAGGEPTAIVIGAADAPNTVTVYLDFLCSGCRRFHAVFGPTLERLQDEGRLTVDYHPMAFVAEGSAAAANAFRCAAEIDPRFGRELHEGLFAAYGTGWDATRLVALARSLRPDLDPDFDACVQTERHAAWVRDVTATGSQGRARAGTPAVYVNGEQLAVEATTAPKDLEAKLR